MEENLKQQPTDKIRIALYGPESTGKTTLAKQLAEHFQSVWIPEFARDYLQEKWNRSKEICQPEDLLPIAIGQMQLENKALSESGKYLFADTNLMCTKVFSEIYYSFCDSALDKAARKHKYDLFFLTDIDVPFEKDDLRDKPDEREMLIRKFEEALIENKKPYILLSGNKEERLQKAIAILEDLEKSKALGFDSCDFVQIYNQGIKIDTVANYLKVFNTGIPKAVLERAASLTDGIMPLSEEEAVYYANLFESKKDRLKIQKFVPASGAASRMFKFLNEFVNEYKLGNETINAYINRKRCGAMPVFLIGIEKFPFHKTVLEYTQVKYPEYKQWDKDTRFFYFVKSLLSSNHFDFASKPKAVLPFHQYGDYIATPIEEHLNESGSYAFSSGISGLHFTISEEHQDSFDKIINDVKPKVEANTNVQIHVDYSYQHKTTDTLAVDLQNNPFRLDDGNLFFRPGGHGALIENLNQLFADVIFIKNIDNVIQNHIHIISLYKKALAGILLEFQDRIFTFLKVLSTENIQKETIDEIVEFVKSKLQMVINADFQKYTRENKVSHLQEILNRPIRVCGMVKNEGEPGGGPFWVRDTKGNVSLQIVESSQVDMQNPAQAKILSSATHFNPVDLICGTKDYRGEKFDLREFIDNESGFIVEKNKNGKPIKAYELPGLWNGAMAKWITIFVEVPLITFNPVKTVNDLLKPAHQPQ
jgi:nicotinamide riboside kinase